MALAVDDSVVESLSVRMKRKANKADVVVGVCYRLPIHNNTTN